MRPLRIIVFAKAPQPGFAKTRLIPALGAEGAALLARRMLQHTLREALAADIGTVELCAVPVVAEAAWQGVELPQGIAISEQGEGDLGARLARASQRAFGGGETVLLVGTDCPQLTAMHLRVAASALNGCDAIIHRAHDGGYALLGLRRFDPLLFSEIPWSTVAVARLTLERIAALGWTVHEGEVLRDIDVPEDLEYLPEQPSGGDSAEHGKIAKTQSEDTNHA